MFLFGDFLLLLDDLLFLQRDFLFLLKLLLLFLPLLPLHLLPYFLLGFIRVLALQLLFLLPLLRVDFFLLLFLVLFLHFGPYELRILQPIFPYLLKHLEALFSLPLIPQGHLPRLLLYLVYFFFHDIGFVLPRVLPFFLLHVLFDFPFLFRFDLIFHFLLD